MEFKPLPVPLLIRKQAHAQSHAPQTQLRR